MIMDPVSVAGLIGVVVQLTGVMMKVISALNDMKNAPKERAHLSIELVYLLNLLTSLRYRVDESSENKSAAALHMLAAKDGPLQHFNEAIERLAAKLDVGTGMKKIKKTISWELDKCLIKTLLNKIERLKSLVGLALQEDLLAMADAIKTDTAAVSRVEVKVEALVTAAKSFRDGQESNRTKQERQEIYDWISPYNFHPVQVDIFKKQQPGSGKWLLESKEFQKWLNDSGRIIWCPGNPGVGKTIMSSIIIDHLQEWHGTDPRIGIAFVYCNYKEEQNQTDSGLVASLWSQLLRPDDKFSEELRRSYKETHKHRGTRPSFRELSEHLRILIRKYQKVFIVVDALDECEEHKKTREHFTDLLKTMPQNTNVLVTSRYIESISSTFHAATRLPIRTSRSDVEDYIRQRIVTERRLRQFCEFSTESEDRIVSTVASKAQNMFLLAQLQMDFLATKTTRSRINDALDRLPDQLNSLYDDAMDRIDRQTQDDQELAHQVLSWVSLSKRRMSLLELQHVLAIQIGHCEFDRDNIPDEELTLSVCAGLVEHDRSSKVVRFIHGTTQTYFERMGIHRLPHAESYILKTCITHLNFKDLEYYALADSGRLFEEYPALLYIVEYWKDHLYTSSDKESQDMTFSLLRNQSRLNIITMLKFHLGMWQYKAKASSRNGLHIAASRGMDNMVEILIQNGLAPSGTGRHLKRPIDEASFPGHESFLQKNESRIQRYNTLVQQNELKIQQNESTIQQNELTIQQNEVRIRALLQETQDIIDTKTLNGQTALHIASKQGHASTVYLLLRNKANINIPDSLGRTPLHLASINAHDAVIQKLLENGAKANVQDDNGATPLHDACEFANFQCVLKLLNAGSDPNIRDRDGRLCLNEHEMRKGETALHRAAKMKDETIVELLLPHIADIDATNGDGYTALTLAVMSGNVDIARALCSNGANGLFTLPSESTLLHLAVQSDNFGMIRLLMEYFPDIDVDAKNANGDTPLSLAISAERTVLVDFLLKNQPRGNTNNQNSYGQTPLHIAAQFGDLDTVRRLIAMHVEIDLRDHYNETPLHRAAEMGFPDVVQELLNANANVLARDKDGETPLHRAVAMNEKAVVRVLLDSRRIGDAVTTADFAGRTPVHRAMELSDTSVLEMLQETACS